MGLWGAFLPLDYFSWILDSFQNKNFNKKKTMKYYFTTSRITKIKKTGNTKSW